MKKIRNIKLLTVVCVVCSVALAVVPPAIGAMSNDALAQKVMEIEQKIEKGASAGLAAAWLDKISISGALELDFSYTDPRNLNDADSDSSSEFDIGTAELGLEVKFNEWVTGNVTLKGENLDQDDRVFWDETMITIQKERFPLYFVGGKRTQPFGVFNSHFINDPITQDCYEIVKTGATIGLTHAVGGLDVSATIYKGEVLADKVSAAAYGWTRDPDPNPDPTDDVNSYVLNLSMAPLEGLSLSVYFDSEPGQQDRNTTVGGSIAYQAGMVTFDAEYIAAVARELHTTDGREYKESAWFAALAFQVTDPLEIAVRYEAFDDDIDGDQDGHLENRSSLGANYRLFEKGDFATTLMIEYRRSNYEKAAGSAAQDTADEVFARLAFEF